MRITRAAVERLFGTDQCRRLEPPLEALRDRQRFARLHYQFASKALTETLPQELPLSDVIERTIPWHPEQREMLDECLTIVEANVIACAQSMHALLDNLAHVIYFGMGMNLDKNLELGERAICLGRIASRVKTRDGTEVLGQSLDGIGDDSAYLSALVNHGKHRSLVPMVLHIDPPARHQGCTSNYQLEFGAFTYDNMPFPARAAFDFLEQDYLRLATKVVETGGALNQWLLDGVQAALPSTGNTD